jgi:uncharacterized protein (TIGR02231 family)
MRMKTVSAASLLALVLASGLTHAADIPVTTKIDAATVYPDGAMVSRVAEVAVPAGSHVLLFRGLPAGIDPASLRFEAKGDAALVIGTVESRAAAAIVAPATELLAKIKRLRDELSGVQGRMDAAEAEKRAIERLTNISAESAAKSDKGFTVEQAKTAWIALGTATAEINEILRQLRLKSGELEAEIRAAEAGIAPGRPAQPRLDVAITVEAPRDMKASIRLGYTLRDARWVPVYDAELSTGEAKPKLSLVRRADVIQRSGEDWADTQLTLSTTRVRRSTDAPEVVTQTVNLFDPALMEAQRQRAVPRRASGLALEDGLAKSAPGLAQALAAPAPIEAERQEASLEAGAFSAAFVAPGRLTVSGDGARKSVRLSAREIEPELIARASPALDPTAYLSASFVQGEEAPLLAGEVNLTRDGTHVGKGRLAFTATGDKVELGFGADDAIKIARVPLRKRDNDPSWASSSRTQVVDMKTTVTNLHKAPMRVQVIDRLPVSENTAILVELLKETTPPTDKAIADRRGVMGWTLDLKPNESRDLRLAWRMKWPADREIVTGQ